MKSKQSKIIYYSDELNDDFAGVQRINYQIPGNYKFTHKNAFWNVLAFIVYRIIMTPIAFMYCKIKLRSKIIDNTAKPLKATKGCFLYANHTLLIGDAFIPSLVMFPKRVYVVVNPENLATKGTRNFLQMSGAIPTAKSLAAFKNFIKTIKQRISEGYCVTIYPEAHVWPYYKGIRPYPSTSFRFPVDTNAPIYVSTATFQKQRFFATPKVTVYLDGPFYPNTALSSKDAEKELRNKAFETMCTRAKNSTYSPVEYRKRDKKEK